MVIVMFEFERRQVQENAVALSALDIEPNRLYTAEELDPAVAKLLARVMRQARAPRALLCIRTQYRHILPSVQIGFSTEVLAHLEQAGMTEPICKAVGSRLSATLARRMDPRGAKL
jgi:hypothetical protein